MATARFFFQSSTIYHFCAISEDSFRAMSACVCVSALMSGIINLLSYGFVREFQTKVECTLDWGGEKTGWENKLN